MRPGISGDGIHPHFSLDVKITRHGSKLSCETYFKPANLFRYLPFHSNHPATVFRSWIGAEIRRYVITNSSLQSFNDTSGAFRNRLKRCGYDDTMLHHVFANATQLYQQRAEMLSHCNHSRTKPRIISMVLPYDPFFVRTGDPWSGQHCQADWQTAVRAS